MVVFRLVAKRYCNSAIILGDPYLINLHYNNSNAGNRNFRALAVAPLFLHQCTIIKKSCSSNYLEPDLIVVIISTLMEGLRIVLCLTF